MKGGILTDHNPSARSWLPLTLGSAATLLGLALLRELLLVPKDQGEFLLLGYWLLTGNPAWTAAATQVLLLFGFAYGCFTYRRAVVWPLLAYCGYWIASVWSWAWTYGSQSNMTLTLTCALITVVLLALCRTVLTHRAEFNQ